MAHQLQRSILIGSLLLGGLAAQKRPFSHKYHLTQVSTCEACHEAATESTSAKDSLLPGRMACVTCHDEVHIKAARPLAVSKFNHKQHLSLGDITPLLKSALDRGTYLAPPGQRKAQLATKNPCAVCHVGIEESESIDPRPEARHHFPPMADCLVCHNKIDPPESCKFCHAPEVAVRPPDHTPKWTDQHSDKNARIDKTGCAVCHGRNFRCQGCH